MHLTPEQIDRQPFRMRKRGYDIMQVRNFLREIAQEMRERQRVREELATTGDPDAVAHHHAHEIVSGALERADEIVRDASHTGEKISDADQTLAHAHVEAKRIIEHAEETARQRSDAVLTETQVRLDALLAEERDVRERLDSIEHQPVVPPPVDLRGIDSDVALQRLSVRAAEGESLAEFMKSTVREDIGEA